MEDAIAKPNIDIACQVSLTAPNKTKKKFKKKKTPKPKAEYLSS